MEAKRLVFALFLALTVTTACYQVSARRLTAGDVEFGTTSLRNSGFFKAAMVHQHENRHLPTGSSKSTGYKDLEEIDRLKLSINKLICGTMEEGCDHMDDATDHSDTRDLTSESFANLNPRDYVREY